MEYKTLMLKSSDEFKGVCVTALVRPEKRRENTRFATTRSWNEEDY
jgi:hypothetical protein